MTENFQKSKEEVAYNLFKDLKEQIIKDKLIFEDMEDQERQQYLLELFITCMEAVKCQRPYVKKLRMEKL